MDARKPMTCDSDKACKAWMSPWGRPASPQHSQSSCSRRRRHPGLRSCAAPGRGMSAAPSALLGGGSHPHPPTPPGPRPWPAMRPPAPTAALSATTPCSTKSGTLSSAPVIGQGARPAHSMSRGGSLAYSLHCCLPPPQPAMSPPAPTAALTAITPCGTSTGTLMEGANRGQRAKPAHGFQQRRLCATIPAVI